MGEMGFSLQEQVEAVNEELSITFKPSTSIAKYTYEVIKDNEVYATYTITSNKEAKINLYETGSYQIKVTEYSYYNKKTEIISGTYNLDLDSPIIRVANNDTIFNLEQLKTGETLDLSDYITATDKQDGDLTNTLKSNANTLDLTKTGIYTLTYTVSDQAGNTTTRDVTLNIVKNNDAQLLAFESAIIVILVIIAWWAFAFLKSLKYEKRIAKYSVDAIKDRTLALFENFVYIFKKYNKKIAKLLTKSDFACKFSKHYQKYVPLYKELFKNEMEIIALKTITAIIFVLIAVISKTIQYEVMHLYQIMLPLLFGFFIPDLIFISRYRIYRNQIENDLLQAIIIMNNAFKSGRSIIQAIELVTKELEGPIAEEFKKMHLELSFGLSVDLVFERFSDRIKLEEVAYLTATLSILNKTGGNIIKVFSSIEKSLFNKKKLKLELLSLTGSSKIIAYILFIIPLLFIVFVSLVSPGYFEPFYTTSIGIIFMFIMLIIYLIYILAVNKIMKVRM